MKIQKRHFYCNNTLTPAKLTYRTRNLRHRFIKWNIDKYGIPEELPCTMWVVRLRWWRSIIPGLYFGEA